MKYNAYNSASFNSAIFANPRTVTFKVIHNGTTTYTQQNIKKFKIDSTPVNGKWFGISYSQQLDVTFIDPTKSISVARGDTLKVSLIAGGTQVDYPTYYVENSVRDEKTGDLSAVGFDIMAKANNIMFTLPSNFNSLYPTGATFDDLCNLAGQALGCNVAIVGNIGLYPSTDGEYKYRWRKDKINIGEEGITLREFIIDLAEVSGRMAYINSNDYLLFRGISGGAGTTSSTINFQAQAHQNVDKSKYFEFSSDNFVVLSGISHTNELNDTVTITAGSDAGGAHQILYDNVFLSLLSDSEIQAILNNIYTEIKKAYYPYQLTWRGSPALEIGDTLWIAQKNCETPVEQWTSSTPGILKDCFYLSETLEYNGGLRGTCEWQWDPSQNVENVSPTNVSDSARTTRAIVDKQNGKITLAVTTAETAGAKVEIQEDRIDAIVGDWGPTGTHTKIEQNSTSINSIAQSMGPTGSYTSYIKQQAEGIASTVAYNAVEAEVGPSGSAWGPSGVAYSMVQQTATQVATTVATSIVDDEIAEQLGPTGPYSYDHLQSQITQNAGSISVVVQGTGPSGTVKAGSIVTAINNAGSSVKINADKIQMTGTTTFLSASDVGPSGTTNIDGGRITTGTISANRIDTTNLYVQNIGSTGWTPGVGQAVNVAGNMYFRDDYSGNLISWEVDGGANVIRNLGYSGYVPNGIVIGRQNPPSLVVGSNDYDAKLGTTYFSSGIWLDGSTYGSSFPAGAQTEGRLFFKI